MNKKVLIFATSITIFHSTFSAHTDCFRPYRAEISNKSGGVANVKKTRGLSGVTRQDEIENNNSVTVMVKKRGAELKVSAGPEENKFTREIEFYSKEPNSFAANVVLNSKGVQTSGFYTKDHTYDVKVFNESGGVVKIIDGCSATGVGRSLSDGKTMTISVKPDSYIVVESGPENRKISYRINFADQTGENPTITFVKRGFMSSGVQQKNLEIQARRVFAPGGFVNYRAKIMAGQRLIKRKKAERNREQKDSIEAIPLRPHIRRAN